MRPVTVSRSVRRLALRAAVSSVAASGLVLGVAPSAHAASNDQLVCTAGGAATIVHNATTGLWDWVLTGVGACTVPNAPAHIRQVTLLGTAATDNLGACTSDALIDAFSMNITATFASAVAVPGTGQTVEKEVWSLPETTFPIASPFTVADASGATVGAGEFETHVFAQCPPDGQPTIQINWVQSAP
jgi:hypothetical protein